jgi:hypothetical protein
MDLETTIASLVSEHGAEKVQEALDKHTASQTSSTDMPPGSTTPPAP